MKKILTSSLVVAIMAAPLAQAGKGHGNGYGKVHWAKVTDVEPITRTVEYKTPVERCWNEQVRYEDRGSFESGSYTSTVLGGIIGGAIGNAVGHKKKNKKIGVAVGSILGATIGHDIGQRDRRYRPGSVSYKNERRCETQHNTLYDQEIVGYEVWYRYHGEEYKTRMNRRPGGVF